MHTWMGRDPSTSPLKLLHLHKTCRHTCMHVEHSLTSPWRVLGTAHLCVYPAQWCSLLVRPSGPSYSPCQHSNLPARPSSSSSSSPDVARRLSFPASSCELMNGPPGDEVIVFVTARSPFPSQGVWKVLYLSRCNPSEGISPGGLSPPLPTFILL